MNKICTSIEQSKKLIELGLDVNTADFMWEYNPDKETYWNKPTIIPIDDYIFVNDIPAWSLAALIEQLPSDIKGHELTIHKSYWQIEKTFAYELSYEEDFEDYSPSILVSTSSIELIDACVEMIIKLNELNLL